MHTVKSKWKSFHKLTFLNKTGFYITMISLFINFFAKKWMLFVAFFGYDSHISPFEFNLISLQRIFAFQPTVLMSDLQTSLAFCFRFTVSKNEVRWTAKKRELYNIIINKMSLAPDLFETRSAWRETFIHQHQQSAQHIKKSYDTYYSSRLEPLQFFLHILVLGTLPY